MGTQLLNPSPAVRSAASLRHGGRFKRLLRQQGSNEQSKMLCRENQHPTGEAPEGTEPDGVHLFLAVRSGVGLLQGIKATGVVPNVAVHFIKRSEEHTSELQSL